MAKEVYSEGRVVGLSGYEEYVRQLKSVDPTFDVCTEREWLSASLAMGTTMILRVPSNAGAQIDDSGMYMYQVELPDGCHLGTGNPLVGTFFYGKCKVDSKGWATLVTDYGSLISNKASSNPSDNASTVTTDTVPVGDIVEELSIPSSDDMSTIEYTEAQKQLNEYVKVVDGIVIQPGRWYRSKVDLPYKDFEPDLTKKPVIRLTFMEQVVNPFYIQITGFTNRSILRGLSKFDFGATETENKVDGDFIGPEAYPWVCKIQFTSSPAVDYLLKTAMKRGSRNVKIETFKDSPLIKITSNNLLDTTVYSRRSNTELGSSTDNFGNPITTWEGTNDASHWYGSTRDENVVSTGNDPDLHESGTETLVTHNLSNKYDSQTPLGFTVVNNYESDDRNVIKNGDHGGWYDVKIDPYQMIKDFIDEVMARFKYVDKRFDEVEAEIKNEILHRQNGDKYVLDQIYSSDGGMNQLIDLINQLLDIVYNPDGGLGIHITWEDVDLDDNYDESITGTIRKPVFSWEEDDEGNPIVPSEDDGRIPRAKLNIYSGDSYGASATDFLRSRTDNSENDLHAK